MKYKLSYILTLFLFIIRPNYIYSQSHDKAIKHLQYEAKTNLHYGTFNDLKNSIQKLDSLRNLHPNKKLYTAIYYAWKGSYCSEIGDYKESLDNELRALKLFKELSYYEGISFAYKEIGATYRYFGGDENLISSIDNLMLAHLYLPKLKLADTNMSNNMQCRVFSNLAHTYIALYSTGNTKIIRTSKHINDTVVINFNDTINKYLKLSVASEKEIDRYGTARNYLILAKNYVRLKEYTTADSLYQRCFEYSNRYKIPITYIDACNSYAEILLKEDSNKLAKKYALLSYQSALENNKKRKVEEASSVLYKIYAKLNQQDSSYYFLKQKDSYRDSVLSEQKVAQWGNFKADKKIEEEDEKRAIEQRNTEISFLVLGGSILIIFRIYVYFLRVRAKRKTLLPKWLTSILDYVGVINLLLIFECFNLAIHHRVAELVHHNAVLMLLITTIIAFGITILEHKIKHSIRGLITLISEQNNPIQNIITNASTATKRIISKRIMRSKKYSKRKTKKHD